jgi:hypothetical protein
MRIGARQRDRKSVWSAAILVAFCISIFVPLNFDLGPLRLSTYRIVLLLSFLPSVAALFRREVKKGRYVDLQVILFCAWVSISYTTLHGFEETWETLGILILEVVGSYGVGRAFVTNAARFKLVTRVFFILIIAHLPFAIYETLTGDNLVMELWQNAGTTYPDVLKEKRLGLDRVQGPFEHPIHFGVVVGLFIGVTYGTVLHGLGRLAKFLGTSAIAITSLLAMSSGPVGGTLVQVGLISWAILFRSSRTSWNVLVIMIVFSYIIIDLLSNRTPIEVIFSYLAFDPETAYARIDIWHYGWQNILANPALGLGFRDWVRAYYMTPSVDMYWIFYALTNGLPAGALQLSCFLTTTWIVAKRKQCSLITRSYKYGWLITMAGVFVDGWMVHFWNAPFVLVYFVMGAGIWMANAENAAPEENPNELLSDATPKYARNWKPIEKEVRQSHEVIGTRTVRGDIRRIRH